MLLLWSYPTFVLGWINFATTSSELNIDTLIRFKMWVFIWLCVSMHVRNHYWFTHVNEQCGFINIRTHQFGLPCHTKLSRDFACHISHSLSIYASCHVLHLKWKLSPTLLKQRRLFCRLLHGLLSHCKDETALLLASLRMLFDMLI